jgi:hypothetical protein
MTGQERDEPGNAQARATGVERHTRAVAAAVRRARGATGRWPSAARNWSRAHGADLFTVLGLVAAFLLIASAFIDVVRFVDSTGAPIDAPGAVRTGADQLGPALPIVGLAAIVAIVLARLTGEPLPAMVLVALGLFTLVAVLALDLPDVVSSGDFRVGGEPGRGIASGDAEPESGFWAELAGSLLLVAAGLGLARALARRT